MGGGKTGDESDAAAPPRGGRRSRHDPDISRTLILDTTEAVMREEGYAAVSTRRVAKSAGLTPSLVHYYFPTTEDLLIAAYRRMSEVYRGDLERALAQPDPVRALWAMESDFRYTSLAMEFVSLANHRKAMREEITQYSDLFRRMKEKAMARVLPATAIDPAICSPACVATLIVSVARTLVTEGAVGISAGHVETARFVEWMLDRVAPRHDGAPHALPDHADAITR